MTDNVVSLGGKPRRQPGTPDPKLVDTLRKLLALAERGQLQSFVGAGFTTEGLRATVWHDTHANIYAMLGSLAWLEHEYVTRHRRD